MQSAGCQPAFSKDRRTELLRLLSAATTHLLEADDPDRLVRGIFDIASGPLGIDTYFNYMVNEHGDALELASCAGIPDEVARSIRRLEFGRAICGTVALLRRPIIATHIQTSGYDKAELVRGFGIRAYACNPLMAGEKLLGTLSFASHTRDTFEEYELEFFRTVCRYAEMTIQRLRLLNRLRHHADLLDLAPDAIVSLLLDGTIQFWNRGAEQTYGWTAEEAVGEQAHQLLRTKFPQAFEDLQKMLLERGEWEGEVVRTRRDGREITVACRWVLETSASAAAGILELSRDITERKRFEEQLRQTQKLESLGILAGSIAHDFNNILVGILGNASLVEDSLPLGSASRRQIGAVVSAAERASLLTRQLLAYAGKGRVETRPVDLSELVREVGSLVQAAIPKQVALRFELTSDLPCVEADVAQLHQVLMNLVINGAEAVGGDHGAVHIRTGVQEVDAGYTAAVRAPYEISPGRYVMLEVQDTGCGMDEATVAKIFDPFFTTKVHGRGLGLSAVQGIVRGHKGALEVASAPGRGTTFRLLLPAIAKPVSPPSGEAVRADGHGLVLVVDDNAVVRQTTRDALEHFGYSVVLAEDGKQALEIAERRPEIVAVLLDITMQVIDGEQTFRRLKQLKPGLPVLLWSGMSEAEVIRRFAANGIAGFLQKPFTAKALSTKLNAVLGGANCENSLP